MELFENAKTVRLMSHHHKYLLADDDKESVIQDRDATSLGTLWTVEFSDRAVNQNIVRFKSCYGNYLTASKDLKHLGVTGRKVILTLPRKLDSQVEWEPIRDGDQVKFKTRYGNYLRANGGLPPWRNSITHDIPLRHTDWILWDIDLVEKKPDYIEEPTFSESPAKSDHTPSPDSHSSHFHFNSPKFPKALGSFSNSPKKSDGRMIYYTIHDDNADAGEETSFVFKGNGLEELIIKLEEETGVEDIILCSRNKMNGKLFPLRLALPPNNASMHVVLVPPTSELVRDFAGSPTTT